MTYMKTSGYQISLITFLLALLRPDSSLSDEFLTYSHIMVDKVDTDKSDDILHIKYFSERTVKSFQIQIHLLNKLSTTYVMAVEYQISPTNFPDLSCLKNGLA